MLSFTRNYQTFFQSDCTILYFNQQYMSALMFPYSCQPFMLSAFDILASVCVCVCVLFDDCTVLRGMSVHNWFSQLAIDGHVFYFQFLATVNEWLCSKHPCTYILLYFGNFLSVGYVPRNGMPELKDTYITSVRRCCQIISPKVVITFLPAVYESSLFHIYLTAIHVLTIFYFCQSNGNKTVSHFYFIFF